MTALPGGGGAVVPLPADESAVAPTRERLLRAAREVVEAHGYAGASVAVIADRAGVAAGTLYRHFGSKAELFVEVFRDVCGHEVDAMQAAVAAVGRGVRPDPVERVLAPLDEFARRALQNRALAWALLAEPVDGLVDEVRLEYRRTYRDLLAGLLAEAVDAGALPPQDSQLTAAALVGAVGEVLVGPLSAAGHLGGSAITEGDPGRPDPVVADAELLAGLRATCRRATGAATDRGLPGEVPSRVRADASGEPR